VDVKRIALANQFNKNVVACGLRIALLLHAVMPAFVNAVLILGLLRRDRAGAGFHLFILNAAGHTGTGYSPRRFEWISLFSFGKFPSDLKFFWPTAASVKRPVWQ